MLKFKVHLETPHARSIRKAVEALQKGQLIIYPTDTVYGIGCSLYEKKAIERLYQIKGKSKHEPMSIICNSIQQASRYARISTFAFRLLKRCFPGPYTIILEASREIPRLLLSSRKEVGIRIPDSAVCHELIEQFGLPVLNSSVNQRQDELLNDPEDIAGRYENVVDVMLNAGPLPDARESTVLRIVDEEVQIIREGKGDLKRLYL